MVRAGRTEEGWTGHRALQLSGGPDCKHAAALLIVARTGQARRRGPTGPPWESRVGPLVRETPQPADGAGRGRAGVLGRACRPTGVPPAPQLRMRPVRRGHRGRWVRSGISWTDLDYPSRRAASDEQDLLLQLRAAAGAAARFSPRRPGCPWPRSRRRSGPCSGCRRFGLDAGPSGPVRRRCCRADRRAAELRALRGGLTGEIGAARRCRPRWCSSLALESALVTERSSHEPFEARAPSRRFGLLGEPVHGIYC